MLLSVFNCWKKLLIIIDFISNSLFFRSIFRGQWRNLEHPNSFHLTKPIHPPPKLFSIGFPPRKVNKLQNKCSPNRNSWLKFPSSYSDAVRRARKRRIFTRATRERGNFSPAFSSSKFTYFIHRYAFSRLRLYSAGGDPPGLSLYTTYKYDAMYVTLATLFLLCES